MTVSKMKTAALLTTVLLTGCTTRFMPLEPTEIDIVPKEVVSRFMETNTNLEPFKAQFNDYFVEHRSMLLTQAVTIEWRGTHGRKMADYARESLLRAGIDPTMLSFHENAFGLPAMSIRYLHHEVAVRDCVPYSSTPIRPMTGNCYVENSRFQSMVNPEKMLPEGTLIRHPDAPPATVLMQ